MISNIVREFDRVAKENATRVVYDEMGQTHTYQDLLVDSNAFAAWLDQEKSFLKMVRSCFMATINLKWWPVLSAA